MSFESPRVMDSRESPADGTPRSFPGRLTRVSGRLPVLVLGIQAGFSLQLSTREISSKTLVTGWWVLG